MGQRLAGHRTEGAEDVALAAAAIVDLLTGSLGGLGGPFDGRLRCGVDDLLSWEALGTLRPHLVEADNGRALRRRGVEGLDDPLFSAKAGSTRSPNQVS
jgi:hypothetical protein